MTTRKREADENPNFESTIRGTFSYKRVVASFLVRALPRFAGLSKDKQDKAKKLAKDFQKGVKDADRPAQSKDRAAVVKAYADDTAIVSPQIWRDGPVPFKGAWLSGCEVFARRAASTTS